VKNFISGYTDSEVVTAIIAWKEKVDYDLVRPASVIKLGGEIMARAPGGAQTFPAATFSLQTRHALLQIDAAPPDAMPALTDSQRTRSTNVANLQVKFPPAVSRSHGRLA
jgi:hypothetical protein